jgi:predicted amidohydrolase
MAALLQALPKPADKTANLTTIARYAGMAAQAGAEFLCCPELFLTGYNLGTELRNLAEPLNGPSVHRLREIAKRSGVGLVVGFPERDGCRTFNSAVAIDAAGDLAGCYRKIQLFGAIEPQIFTPGDGLVIARMGKRRIGLAICYDIEFPEISRGLARAGAEMICAPTANMAPFAQVCTTLVRARALENGVAVVYANIAGQDGDLLFIGGSAIVGFDGRDVARAGTVGECFLHARASDTVPATKNHPLRSTQLQDLRAEAVGRLRAG